MITHLFKTVTIPTADVLSLNSAPVQLVAGSPGDLFNVYTIYIKYLAGGTPFTVNPNDYLVAYTGDGTGSGSLLTYPGLQVAATGIVDQATDQAFFLDGWFGGPNTLFNGPFAAPASDVVGAGLYLIQFDNTSGDYTGFPTGTDWTDGDGSLVVTVEYSYLLA